jgi:putative zinc finger/helix-turn-helix YgiT family protein
VTRSPVRSRERRQAVRLPDDACPKCGTMMRERRSTLTMPVNGEVVRVPNSSHLHCPQCGEIILRFDEAGDLERRGFELYRARHHLLGADDIRALRRQLGLSQAELARILRLGSNTISRWEAGRNVQSAAMDVLLRLIRDVPETLKFLRRHAA